MGTSVSSYFPSFEDCLKLSRLPFWPSSNTLDRISMARERETLSMKILDRSRCLLVNFLNYSSYAYIYLTPRDKYLFEFTRVIIFRIYTCDVYLYLYSELLSHDYITFMVNAHIWIYSLSHIIIIKRFRFGLIRIYN